MPERHSILSINRVIVCLPSESCDHVSGQCQKEPSVGTNQMLVQSNDSFWGHERAPGHHTSIGKSSISNGFCNAFCCAKTLRLNSYIHVQECPDALPQVFGCNSLTCKVWSWLTPGVTALEARVYLVREIQTKLLKKSQSWKPISNFLRRT